MLATCAGHTEPNARARARSTPTHTGAHSRTRARTTHAHALRQLYRDLGLRRSATQTEIKAAYRDLAKRYHPDKNKAPNADTKFKQVAAAHETLSDPDKRRLYDMYGDDYENVQKQRSQQQQQYRRQDFDPFGRRRPQGPPIFSVTMTLTPENYRDLVEESESSWLLQFYHDHSEPCKEFAQRWEALAHKLSPMVRLGRVRIDDNFGLVQRYRNFLRCRQNAFFVQCDTPALVLVSPTPPRRTNKGALCLLSFFFFFFGLDL